MSINPLNDISRVYLEQVVTQEVEIDEGMTLKDYKKKKSALKQKEKRAEDKIAPGRRAGIHADKASPERAARHRANVDPDFEGNDERNYPGGKLKNPKKIRKAKALGELGESAVPGKPAEKLGAVTAIPKSEQEAARERILAKTKAKREKIKEERNDEPGEGTRQKYGDMRGLDRSGAPTSFGGKWQSKERKEAALAKLRKEALDPVGQEDADIDNDGDTDKTDKYLHNRRKAIGKAIAKNRKKDVKEGFSNWRQDLAEVMTDTESEIKIKEKKVNNKIKINPKLGESVEEIGGVLLEMVEIDEVDFVVESVYGELLDEGYEENDIEEALEYALTEATVTYGHDTPTGEKKKGNLVKAVGRLARQKLSSKVRGAKTAAKAAVARGARKVAKGALGVARKMEGGKEAPKTAERKPSTYRGAGAGTKEKVSSGSYTPPTQKKAEKPADPWEGSATTPTKAKTKKTAAPKAKAKAAAAPKRKRKSKLDDLLASVRSEQFQQIDELSVNKMHAYINKAEKDRDRLNKKWDQGTATPKERKKVFDREEGEARASKKIRQKTGKDSFRLNALDKLKSAVTKEETQLDEKALSKQQQKFMGMVYAVKKGDMEAPSPEVAKAAKSMTTQQAKDFAKTKHKGLPEVKEQMDDSTELSSTPTDDKRMEQQKKKIQMQKIRDLTVRLAAARKGVY